MQFFNILLLKVLFAIFAVLPFPLLYLLSDLACFLLAHVFRYREKVVFDNLQKSFPERPPAAIEALSQRYYAHLADLLLESIKGLTLPAAVFQRRFKYLNPGIFPKGKSAILLGSHYGNWEWGVVSFPAAVRHQVVGIYKPLRHRRTEALLNRLRTRLGLHLAPMNHAGRAFVEFKGTPSIFVLIADQTPSDLPNAHWLPFLHQDTPFLHGADKLARQTGYPVFVFDIRRVKRGFYEVTFSELCAEPQATTEGEITRRFAEHLEASIRREPEHWLWSHRRWKHKRGKG